MTTRYVGIGGDNANSGLSWALRKLTLNGVEDSPIQAGDTVYIGAGTYRETLTCDVNGSAGNIISYIGDVDGTHTDGVGGTIRLTGVHADENAYSLNNLIFMAAKAYRTFEQILFDSSVKNTIQIQGASDEIVINRCVFNVGGNGAAGGVYLGQTARDVTVTNCIFIMGQGTASTMGVNINLDSEANDAQFTVNNCLFFSGGYGIYNSKADNLTVKNCTFYRCQYGVRSLAISTSYPTIVNNCLIFGAAYGVYAASSEMLVEDYNNFDKTDVERTNVAVGANSLAYPTNFDIRWATELLWNNGTMVTPFDMASYSALINVAGTSPTASDLRGTTVQGTQREWGALEYDSTLDIEAGSGLGTSSVKILPLFGSVRL